MTENKKQIIQLPLAFKALNKMQQEDYMVSSCNREAFQMINLWPQWLSSGLIIYGPQGCGKSHLAHIFTDKVHQAKLSISIVRAENLTVAKIKKIAEQNQCLVVEDITQKANAEALFHLFNLYNTEGRYILWTSEIAPSRMHLALKDLQSRLNMLPCIEIKEPDDVMVQTLIVKLFSDRQLIISEDILNYIVNNSRRSFAYIQQLVDEIDYISMIRKTSINYTVVKQAMERISDKQTKEPDLFSD